MQCLKFEVKRCPRSLGLFVPLEALQWAEEAANKLCRLAPTVWELCGDIFTFGAGLLQVQGPNPDEMIEVCEGKASAQP